MYKQRVAAMQRLNNPKRKKLTTSSVPDGIVRLKKTRRPAPVFKIEGELDQPSLDGGIFALVRDEEQLRIVYGHRHGADPSRIIVTFLDARKHPQYPELRHKIVSRGFLKLPETSDLVDGLRLVPDNASAAIMANSEGEAQSTTHRPLHLAPQQTTLSPSPQTGSELKDRIRKLGNKTKAELLGTNDSSRFKALIWEHSRAIYELSGNPGACYICGYDFYVEICHRRPVADFPGETLLSEINHIDNLVALCPNHHKEFDLGALALR